MAVRVLALFERHLSALACSGGIRKASLLATHQKTMWTGSAHAREGTRALRAPLLRTRLLRGDPQSLSTRYPQKDLVDGICAWP